MSQTKEPWKVVNRGDDECCDIDAKGPEGWFGDVTIAMNIGNDNARRIVACVNSCAGITTELLESVGTSGINSELLRSANKIEDLEVTIRGMEAMLTKLQTEFNRAISKVESATCCHPNAVRFLLDEAIDIWGASVAIEVKDDGEQEEELHL